jgi:hypothetical protein
MFILVDKAVIPDPDNIGRVSKGSYCKPSKVAFDEPFTVKIQCLDEEDMLLVHDKSRECQFYLGPDQNDYEELLDKVHSQTATAGTKIYLTATFDDAGQCKLYINQKKMKTW